MANSFNFGHIEKEIVDTLASKFTESSVLDGEMVFVSPSIDETGT